MIVAYRREDWAWTSHPRQRTAFTLLELVIVLLLLSLVAVVGLSTVRYPLSRVRLKNACDVIMDMDAHARNFAEKHQSTVELRFSLSEGEIALVPPEGSDLTIAPVTLPRGVTLTKLTVARQRDHRKEATLFVSPRGTTPSYAVELASASGEQKVLLFSGLTGCVSEVSDEKNLEVLFAQLRANSPHPP